MCDPTTITNSPYINSVSVIFSLSTSHNACAPSSPMLLSSRLHLVSIRELKQCAETNVLSYFRLLNVEFSLRLVTFAQRSCSISTNSVCLKAAINEKKSLASSKNINTNHVSAPKYITKQSHSMLALTPGWSVSCSPSALRQALVLRHRQRD